MRSRASYLSLLAIFGFAGALHAQTAPSDPATPAPAPAPKDATASLTVAEMQKRSTATMEQTGEALRQVLHLKEQAKKQKDVIRLNCVNDKLVKLKAQLNLADTANADLQASLTANRDDRFTLYVALQDVATQIDTIRQEANACSGEPDLFKQEAGVTVTRPEIIDDPTQGQPPFSGELEPPGYASPFN